MDEFILYGIAAGTDEIEDSGLLKNATDEEKENFGVIIGSGIGGIQSLDEASKILVEKGARRISPFFIPSALINLLSGHLSMRFGLKGPNMAVVTACASGTHSIGDAYEIIKRGDAIAMVAGGAEAAIATLPIAGFAASRALSTKYNDTPKMASRPWDKESDGCVMGEGSGMLVLEEYEHAKARGAKIYAEVIGYGVSGDAYHITAPAPEGEGGLRAMKMAIKKAGIEPKDIDYINAHGTSTMGDSLELNAVLTLMGKDVDKVSMSSTKSCVGHLLGAAGAVEAIYSILAMRDGIMPATMNLDNPIDEASQIDLIPNKPKKKDLNIVLSNSFGFGGTNASIVLKKI